MMHGQKNIRIRFVIKISRPVSKALTFSAGIPLVHITPVMHYSVVLTVRGS